MGTALEVRGLGKKYGAITVVDGVDFRLARGECVGVVGPNGAGKSTLFNLLDGSVVPDRGTVMLGGRDVTSTMQYQRARLGLGRAFQIPRPFVGISVADNVLAGVMHGARLQGASARRRAAEILEMVGLADRHDRLAGSLPLLDRKRLELARAVSVGSEVLLLDEIAGGLTEQEVFVVVEIVRALKRDRGVIWIEHIAHALMAVADRIMVLHFGKKIADGEPVSVMNSALVQEIYLGSPVDGVT
ncbi:ABC transporter ATP-binding protein [Paraburkholderia ferrariae]|uniref:ABC transporter ATP-binding protein n=1 Tax=Paraburkholderia ferrariae TaxID=386056 RepID=UPI0005A64D4B|nr:ABC transporter ATP-binding protein [Paraburkholderia ferrariae]